MQATKRVMVIALATTACNVVIDPLDTVTAGVGGSTGGMSSSDGGDGAASVSDDTGSSSSDDVADGSADTGSDEGESTGGDTPGVACPVAIRRGSGTTYYVDGACGNDGDGLADGCADAPGAPGAFRNPQSCFTAAVAGDTCLIKDGVYVTANDGGDASEDGGFAVAHSGTPGEPIVFAAYPGHAPLLSNCTPDRAGYCPRPTISAHLQSHVVFDGLHVSGGYSIFGGDLDAPQTGLAIVNGDITQGWADPGDGNWAGINITSHDEALVRCNHIHDISVPAGGGQQSSGGCIKLYHNTDSIIEYNTCRGVAISESQAGGIDDKARAIRNVHRYNWIEDVPSCVRVNNQLESTGVQVYQNVCIAKTAPVPTNIGMRLIIDIDGVDLRNNTIHGFGVGIMIMSEGGPVENARIYDNIFSQIGDNNIEAYQGPALQDFNAYDPDALFLLGGTWYGSPAEVAGSTSFDAHSIAVDCSLSGDFHLEPDSPCIGAGRSDGTEAGDVVDLGAYVNGIDCIGHEC